MTLPTSDDLANLAPPTGASLSEVQEWMARLLRHGKGLTKSEAMQQAAALHFSGNDRLSPAEQIDIYRQQFWLRHTSVLIDDFPGVTGLLGQKSWEKVAESYLITRGYDSFALKDLGRHLPAHLESFEDFPTGVPQVPRQLLVDMARLECAYAQSFDVKDDPQLSPEKLAKIPPAAWEDARFEMSASMTLLRVSYPVADIRRALKATPKDVDRSAIEERPLNLVIYRRERNLWDKAVSNTAFLLLEQFQQGTPLVSACEAVVGQDAEAASVLDEQLMEWFTLWGRLGWIVDVHTD